MRDQEDMVMVLDYKSVDVCTLPQVCFSAMNLLQYLTDDNFTGQNHLQHFSSFNLFIIWQCTASALQMFYIIPNKKNLLIAKLTEWFLCNIIIIMKLFQNI